MSPTEDQAGSAAQAPECAAPEPGRFFAKLAAALPPALENLEEAGYVGSARRDETADGGAGGVGGVSAAAARGGEGWAVRGVAAAGGGKEGASATASLATAAKDPRKAVEGCLDGSLSVRTLLFDSRFEGGNLAKVVQVHELECKLMRFNVRPLSLNPKP